MPRRQSKKTLLTIHRSVTARRQAIGTRLWILRNAIEGHDGPTLDGIALWIIGIFGCCLPAP